MRQLHDLVRAKSELWLSSVGAEQHVEIERSFGVMPAVEAGWENSCDGPTWMWYLLAVLPLGPQLQVGWTSRQKGDATRYYPVWGGLHCLV